jgi:TctA family transporter
VAMNQIVPYNVVNIQLGPVINYERTKNFTHILVCHIISNSIMNIINIVVSRNWVEVSSLPELQVLILFYFCKLFFNYCILMYSKNNIDKIEDSLVCSYVFQIVLFCFFVYALTKTKNDINSTVLIVNNVLLNIGDLTFRVILEYKMRNTVNVV